MMPNLDGMELVRQLREAGWDVPVLILTAREWPRCSTRAFWREQTTT